MVRTTLEAPDISCDHCINSIKKAMNKLPGVQFIEGDPGKKKVVIEFDPASTGIETIEQTMEEEGYPVKK